MITYVKNVSYNSPDKNLLENILSKFKINSIKTKEIPISELNLSAYFEIMQNYKIKNENPEKELFISISSAPLCYFSREIGATVKSNIWVYYPSFEDYLKSEYKEKVEFDTWRNSISKNLVFHELMEYVSENKSHKDLESEHLELGDACVSTVNYPTYLNFFQKLDYAYSKELCPSCDVKIKEGLKKLI